MVSKVGRPTKYKKEYCQALIDTLSRGGYAVTFCSEIGISESTFQDWVKANKEFSKSYKIGRTVANANFLKKLGDAAWGETDKRVNNGLISLLAVNCYDMRTKEQVTVEEESEVLPIKVDIKVKSAKKT